ncbi:hypothetical protein [Mulberry dwarf phytoplasma]|uniref:hypothetical protein n=1 Tax=Mulberry dwarf phytoplasma TaxID=186171 RepID=UPI001D11524E|nr:hypothetical protein [Mulberry dwarf phytoplasma]
MRCSKTQNNPTKPDIINNISQDGNTRVNTNHKAGEIITTFKDGKSIKTDTTGIELEKTVTLADGTIETWDTLSGAIKTTKPDGTTTTSLPDNTPTKQIQQDNKAFQK